MNAEERGASRPAGLAPCVLLVLAVAALYARTAGHAFVSYDDGSYLTENPPVAGGLTAANARWAFGAFHSSNWHPLTWLSHQLDVTLFGLTPGPHHLVNAGLHALNAVLLLLFLRRATGWPWASALVALAFAVHPQRVESVAWASERKDVLSGLFFFLTLLAYQRHARAPSPGRYALVGLCFALGLLAKPMLVTLPLLLVVLDAWPLGRGLPWRPAPGARPRFGLVLEKLPLLVLSAASAAVTLVAQHRGGAVQSIEVLAPSERFATAIHGAFFYLAKLVWPSRLAFFYPHPALVAPEEFAPLGARVWAGLLGLVLVTAGAWLLRKRFPFLLAGWAWMGILLLPVIGLVQVGAQFYADRYAYLPMIGPTFALVFLARAVLPGARARRAGFAVGVLAALALAFVARRQVATWQDSRTLCERALAVTQRNYVAHEHLGLFLQRQGELERAEEQYRAALAIGSGPPSTHGNLGALHAQRGRREEAIAEFRAALGRVPDFLPARLSWGLLLEIEGDWGGALEHYAIGAREHPESGEAWRRLGDACLALGRAAEALAAFEHAHQRSGASAELLAARAEAELALGRARDARASLAEAERLAPESARVLHGTAWLHATTRDAALRDPGRALARLEQCRARDGAGWSHLRTLAAALAAAGRFPEAARVAAEASAAAPRSAWEPLQAERESYLAGRALER